MSESGAWRDPASWVLVAIAALLPFGAASELPILIAALWALVRLPRVEWRSPAVRLALALFGAYWLPELVSAFDSLDARKSWLEVAADVRFGLLLLFATIALRDATRVRFAVYAIGVIVAIWCIDALVQAMFGVGLGGVAQADRVSGIFGDDNLKLGGVIAVLSPFALVAALRTWVPAFAGTTEAPRAAPARRSRAGGSPGARRIALALTLLAVGTVVLLAGARAAWLMFAIALACLAVHALGVRRGALALGALALTAIISIAIANTASPRFAERLDRTAQALRGDPVAIDYALSHRLPIWRTALAMTAAHPFNGIGVRAFHEAYASYAAPDDHWLDPAHGDGAFHAHQWVLEVASETGIVGVVAWLAGLVVALRAWRAAPRTARARAIAPAAALAAMLFPLNTHYAMYSTFWGILLFVLLAMWIAALHAKEPA